MGTGYSSRGASREFVKVYIGNGDESKMRARASDVANDIASALAAEGKLTNASRDALNDFIAIGWDEVVVEQHPQA